MPDMETAPEPPHVDKAGEVGTSTQASRTGWRDHQHAVLIPDAGQLQEVPLAAVSLAAWPTEVVVVMVFLLKIPGAISLRSADQRAGMAIEPDLLASSWKAAGDPPLRMTRIRVRDAQHLRQPLETTTTAMPTWPDQNHVVNLVLAPTSMPRVGSSSRITFMSSPTANAPEWPSAGCRRRGS